MFRALVTKLLRSLKGASACYCHVLIGQPLFYSAAPPSHRSRSRPRQGRRPLFFLALAPSRQQQQNTASHAHHHSPSFQRNLCWPTSSACCATSHYEPPRRPPDEWWQLPLADQPSCPTPRDSSPQGPQGRRKHQVPSLPPTPWARSSTWCRSQNPSAPEHQRRARRSDSHTWWSEPSRGNSLSTTMSSPAAPGSSQSSGGSWAARRT